MHVCEIIWVKNSYRVFSLNKIVQNTLCFGFLEVERGMDKKMIYVEATTDIDN